MHYFDKINRMFFFKSLSGDLLVIRNKLTKFQGPGSNSFQDILLTDFTMSHRLTMQESKRE